MSDNQSKNTSLILLYTDADNYSSSIKVVLKGEISEVQRKMIESSFDEDGFIAHQVGLPTPSEQLSGHDNYPNSEIDHVFTTIDNIDCVDEMITDAAHTHDVSISQLAHSFDSMANKWDIQEEFNRLGFEG